MAHLAITAKMEEGKFAGRNEERDIENQMAVGGKSIAVELRIKATEEYE